MIAADPVLRFSTREDRRSGRAPQRARRSGFSNHLPMVMNEIVDLMRARGALLTLHSSNGSPPALIYADRKLPEQTREAMLHNLLVAVRPDFDDEACFWREGVGGSGSVMLMPVEQLDGHGRLVISILFDELTPEGRAHAERLHRERRPMAVGFFQLWQHNRMLEQRAQALESVLDQTAIGFVMINRGGQIIFANQTANEILATGDGIGRSNGALRAVNLIDGVNLQAALSHAIAGDEGEVARMPNKVPLLAFSRRKGPPLVAAVLPALAAPVEQGDVAAIVYLVDPQIDTEKMLAPLCRLYGLSPVETTLVCHLAAGETTASAAERMHVKEQTARGYLKTIFIKTGTKRQTELIVLMLSSLIRMKRDVLQEAITFRGGDR